MRNKSIEELTPVQYDETLIKFLHFTHDKNYHSFALHWHERIEILKINSGSMKIQIGDNKRTVYKDDIIFVFPGTPHEGHTDKENVDYDVIMFELSILKNDTYAYKNYIEPIEHNNVIFYEIIKNSEILKIINRLIYINASEKHKDTGLSSLFLLGEIYTLFGKLYEIYGNSLTFVNRSDSSFIKVIDYINDNYTRAITTQSVSELFGYNESYFSRKFKQLTGISSAKYIQILRLEHAEKLLKSTNQPISEIAKSSGFSDINYFNHCFKKHYKTSPTKLREKSNK